MRCFFLPPEEYHFDRGIVALFYFITVTVVVRRLRGQFDGIGEGLAVKEQRGS
jgi:hypothetical protein